MRAVLLQLSVVCGPTISTDLAWQYICEIQATRITDDEPFGVKGPGLPLWYFTRTEKPKGVVYWHHFGPIPAKETALCLLCGRTIAFDEWCSCSKRPGKVAR